LHEFDLRLQGGVKTRLQPFQDAARNFRKPQQFHKRQT
jgi:hypothetical protein